MKRLRADEGESRWGYEARAAYFAQDHKDLLDDPKATPLGLMQKACPTEPEFAVRGRLGRVLFSGGDVNKRIATLSGGEAARVVFARIMAASIRLETILANHLPIMKMATAAKSFHAKGIRY